MERCNLIRQPNRGDYLNPDIRLVSIDYESVGGLEITHQGKTFILCNSNTFSVYDWKDAHYLDSNSRFRLPTSEEWSIINTHLDEINQALRDNNYPEIDNVYWCADSVDADYAKTYSAPTRSIGLAKKTDLRKIRLIYKS